MAQRPRLLFAPQMQPCYGFEMLLQILQLAFSGAEPHPALSGVCSILLTGSGLHLDRSNAKSAADSHNVKQEHDSAIWLRILLVAMS